MNLTALIFRIFSQFRLVGRNLAASVRKRRLAQPEAEVASPTPDYHTNRKKGKILAFGLSLLFGLAVTQIYAAFPPAGVAQQTGPASQLVSVGHTREFRGVWVATVANIDWPSKRGVPVQQQKAELIRILDQMQALNLNALVLQVRPAGDAFYNSQLEPWSAWLTGTQGKPPEPFYDPLQFAIVESHKRNIELHAWFNPYRAQAKQQFALANNHMAEQYPEYAYEYGDLLWMDPGAKVVQDKTYEVIMDVVRRYDVDGIHLDDYFYPYPEAGIEFPDSRTYSAYRAAGGSLSRGDWRRDNVNRLMKRLSDGIRAAKPYVKFGISPFGIYRPGQPAGIVGLDQYGELYADAKKWLAQGWVDYMAPQLYWRIDPPQQSYPALLTWWTQNNPQGRHIYAGNYLSQLNGESWPISEFKRQVEISRRKADDLSLGNIFFSMKVFKENRLGVNEAFKASIYPRPALPPAMPWLDAQPPAPPTGVTASAGTIAWDPAVSDDIRSWTVYKRTGNSWALLGIVPAGTAGAKVGPGTYAVSAVDRIANESQGVVVSVQ
ncbi:MAG: family 10 glycosylhydrolase [Oscillatoria princeps RMCB-10]|jgi:uncharacterized lipoprotein YddW (UPF0748 family)|nr:family 10 glycosylhydrolase [Oscillatoria princeps RMCB-10]